MTKHNQSHHKGGIAKLIVLALVGIALLLKILVYITGSNVELLNPKGPIAGQQLQLLTHVVGILLVVAVPTLAMLYFFAWKYRESNFNIKHAPNNGLGKTSSFGLWLVPIAVLLLLTSAMWPATRRLDPHKAIDSSAKPLKIQVVALRSKWLFIYPQQNIATVNFIQIPTNTPVQFDLTADEAPMNSFWIPQLGGQLYAMTGHQNRLNLMAAAAGDYNGSAAEINGPGFAGMRFTARASSQKDFEEWTGQVQQSGDVLDSAEYKRLLVPSENNPAMYYASADSNLYATALLKYSASHGGQMEQQ